MMIRLKALVLAFMCCLIAPTAIAANESPNNSYIFINAGLSKAKGACAFTYTSGASCSEKGKIYRLGYGYHFTPTWGMEISYGDFGKAQEDGTLATPPLGVPGGGPIPYTWTWDARGWEFAATGTLHLGDSLSLVGKLGYVMAQVGQEFKVTTTTNEVWHAVMHEDNASTSAGIGVQYDFNRDYALRFQYENFGSLGSTSKIKTSAVSACIALKF